MDHYCKYPIVKKTVTNIKDTKGNPIERTWIERCRCGRCKDINWKYFNDGRKSPTRTIRWYDAEGNLERVTGDVSSQAE